MNRGLLPPTAIDDRRSIVRGRHEMKQRQWNLAQGVLYGPEE